jgi:hypothetical protein
MHGDYDDDYGYMRYGGGGKGTPGLPEFSHIKISMLPVKESQGLNLHYLCSKSEVADT